MAHPANYALTCGSYYSNNPYNRFACIWQKAESYLDVGQQRYEVSDLEKLELSEERYSFTTTSDILLRIAKVVSYVLFFPVALGALCVRSYFRSKWRINEHFKTYPGITSFTLTPPGIPIPSLAALQASKKPLVSPPQLAPPPARPSLPVNSYMPAFSEAREFQYHLPEDPAPEPVSNTVNIGTQVAGNAVFRVLERNPDAPYLPNQSIVTDEDGYSCLYIRGNNDRDILIRKN